MQIRTATMADLPVLTAIEAACFPAAEAATEKDFAARLAAYPNHFWLLEADDGTVASFINGLVTDEPDLRDEMYADASFHNENGAWQMIFGVNTLPEYRRRGLAGRVMERVIADARAQGRKACRLSGGATAALIGQRSCQKRWKKICWPKCSDCVRRTIT